MTRGMNHLIYSRYYVYYCKNCYKDILKSLEDSVEMQIIQRECDTYSQVHTKNQTKQVQNLTAKYNPNDTANSKWKFTNDSRRKIIKNINDNPPK